MPRERERERGERETTGYRPPTLPGGVAGTCPPPLTLGTAVADRLVAPPAHSGDTTPRKATPVILHGVVSYVCLERPSGALPPDTLNTWTFLEAGAQVVPWAPARRKLCVPWAPARRKLFVPWAPATRKLSLDPRCRVRTRA